MPKSAPIRLRPYANPDKAHLKYRLPVPKGLRPIAGAGTRFFTTKREGDAYVAWLSAQQKKYGEAGTVLDEGVRVDALRAVEVLRPFGVSLFDAAKIAAERLASEKQTVSFEQLHTAYIHALTFDGANPEHIRTARAKLKRFRDDFAAHLLTDLDTPAVDAWLRKLNGTLSPVTRNGVRTYLRAAFEFARKQGWIRQNPVNDTATASVAGKPVSILTPDQMRALLKAADPRLRHAFVLGGFAGLRPSETARIKWSDITTRTIAVDSDDPRSYARRFIPTTEQVIKWLVRDYRYPEGPVVTLSPQQINTLRRKAAEAAGIIPWPTDVLRHSFASYHFAKHQDLPTLVSLMGHSDTKMIAAFYRERVAPDVAEEWWGILPTP